MNQSRTECATCGAELGAHETRCPTCGKPTAYYHRQRTCLHCGSPAAEKAKTCMMCGQPVDTVPLQGSVFGGSWVGIGLGFVIVVGLVFGIIRYQARDTGAAAAQSPLPTPTVTSTMTPTPTNLPPTGTPGPTPTPTVTPTPTLRRHVIQSGENPSSIAQLYGTTMEEVIALNNLTDTTALRVGQVILIPSSAVFDPGVAGPQPTAIVVTYEVQAGDTLLDIALKNGSSVSAIEQANPNQNLNIIFPGQQLQVPLGTPTPTPTLTPAPTETFTPQPAYPAPTLLSPVPGQVVDAPTLLLTWASPTLLAEDEFYRLEMTWQDGTQTEYWTKSTAWRIDKADRPANGQIEWTVNVMRRLSGGEGRPATGIRLNDVGEVRTVEWR